MANWGYEINSLSVDTRHINENQIVKNIMQVCDAFNLLFTDAYDTTLDWTNSTNKIAWLKRP